MTNGLFVNYLYLYAALSRERGSMAAIIRLMKRLLEFTLLQCTAGFCHVKMFT